MSNFFLRCSIAGQNSSPFLCDIIFWLLDRQIAIYLSILNIIIELVIHVCHVYSLRNLLINKDISFSIPYTFSMNLGINFKCFT